jgi:tRNA G10  N-methylase Trm11
MFKTIAIHGRQPALGRAELESLYGAEVLTAFGAQASLLTIEPVAIDFARLGGTIRLAKILHEFSSTNWPEIEAYLLKTTPEHAQYIDGKLSFGISVFGVAVSPRKLAATALSVKKAIRKTGASVRMVPHDKTELGSATVLYNKLTAKNGWELLIVSDGGKAYLAQTVKIQDIDAYTARDRERPYRDAKVGMLPPKLAQIIINLAANQHKVDVVLDPFCGTGVVLQEAMLMDYHIYGSDLEPRMVQYSIDNLTWLDEKYPHVGDYRRVEIGNATSHRWHQPEKITTVAGETYLGKPLSALPPGDQLAKIMQEVNALHHRFLENISKQLKSDTRLCLAVPTWRGKYEFLHLSALDYLEDLGYNRVKFTHVADKDLIYHREGQVVGRELLVLEKR